MKRAAFVIVVFALLAAAAFALAGSTGTKTHTLHPEPGPHVDAITGRVVDSDGSPVAGLDLVLVPRDSTQPGTLPAGLEGHAPDPRGFFGIARAPHPDRPGTRRATSDADGAFVFAGLDLELSFLLFATPGTHVVVGTSGGAAWVPGDQVDLVAHELVDLTVRFTPVDGAPTERILVRVETQSFAADAWSQQKFGQELLVDAANAVLRVPRAQYSVTARSWTGSNENKGVGGFEWSASGYADTKTSNTIELRFNPTRAIDAFVRNSPLPFDRDSRAYVEVVPRDQNDPSTRGRSPSRSRIDEGGTATVVLHGAEHGANGPHVARLFSTNGRLLAEQPVDIVAPRTAVRFDLAALPVAHLSVAVEIPDGFTLDGLRIFHTGASERSIEQAWSVAPDGRLSIGSAAVADEVLAGARSTRPSQLHFRHPQLGNRSVTLEHGILDYRVVFEPTLRVRLKLVGDQAAELVTSVAVSAGLVDPVDGFAPHVIAPPSQSGVERDTATNTLTVTGIQPGRWRILVQCAPVAERFDMWSARTLATIEADLTLGVHEFEVMLPRRHAASIWCPSEWNVARTVRLRGQGLILDRTTDTSGRLHVEGLLAGRYTAEIDPGAVHSFEFFVPCDEVLWAGRSHDALRVAITRDDSPLAAAGLVDGDLVIGFDGLTFRQQKDWHTVAKDRVQPQFDIGEPYVDPPYSPYHIWSLTAYGSTKLRVQRGDEVIDVAVGPIAAHTPEELEALGGTLTPVYRE